MYAILHLQADSGTWYWAVNLSRRGELCYRRFYEPKYGGSANALKAATAWRNEQLSKLQQLSMVEFCQLKRSNNTSGVPGVHFLKSPRQPEGFWQAKLKLGGGKYKSKTFAVSKHGYQSGYEMAIAARNEMLASAADQPFLRHPVAKHFARRPKA